MRLQPFFLEGRYLDASGASPGLDRPIQSDKLHEQSNRPHWLGFGAFFKIRNVRTDQGAVFQAILEMAGTAVGMEMIKLSY